MAQVRVEPLGIEIDVMPGETLMRAAVRQGYVWPTVCQGAALCGTCSVVVKSSSEPLPAPGRKEQNGLLTAPTPKDGGITRLACQLKPTGRLVVEKFGVEAKK
jgi:ferredoxin, 2Fe-2S